MTRPVLTKPFKAWSMIVVLIPVYAILISSQSCHSSAPNWHALNYWLAYTMTDTYVDGFVTLRPIAMKFGWDQESVSSLKFRKFHLNPSNFNRKLTMMFKLDLKKMTLTTFRTSVQNGSMQKVNIFCTENALACILCTHQKSYKLDKDIMLIFVSDKNRPLLLAKGVDVALTLFILIVTCSELDLSSLPSFI